MQWRARDGRIWQRHGDAERPFLIKGVCYSPTPIGMTNGQFGDPLGAANETVWKRDLQKLREMGANAIHVYDMDTVNLTAGAFLDAAWNDGANPVYALLSLTISSGTFASGAGTREVIRRYATLAREYGKYPAVLGFALGNEFNDPADDALRHQDEAQYWTNFNALVCAVRAIVGDTKIITTSLIDPLGDEPAHDFLQRAVEHEVSIDAWGINLYRRWEEFSAVWDFYQRHEASRPLLVTEFGVPASSDHANGTVEEAGSEAMVDACDYMARVWNAIQARQCGGFIFEWSDEWWKQDDAVNANKERTCVAPAGDSSACMPNRHDRSMERAAYAESPDRRPVVFLDQEWFGLNAVSAGTPNALAPRRTYEMFKAVWPEVVVLMYPSGGDRALQYAFFDGTSANVTSRPIPGAFADEEETYGVTDFGSATFFYRAPGADDSFVDTRFDGSQWSSPVRTTPGARGRIAAGSGMIVFASTSGALHVFRQAGPEPIPGAESTTGVAVAEFAGDVWCVHRGSDHSQLYVSNARNWPSDRPLGNKRSWDTPALAAYEGRLFCLFNGVHDTNLWYATMSPDGNWTDERKISDTINLEHGPALAVLNNTLYCFYRNGKTLRYISWDRVGQAWTGETELTGLSDASGPPAATGWPGRWFRPNAPDFPPK
jgi:hypothetical protein